MLWPRYPAMKGLLSKKENSILQSYVVLYFCVLSFVAGIQKHHHQYHRHHQIRTRVCMRTTEPTGGGGAHRWTGRGIAHVAY